ncbi:uncharacterized protein GIQ15_00906 [Arthroderma uncinatum]|uniref:uncharacterized protein n=1 Tax=Arthroderma uncinatum TaxID=74035 RepID=UPI00144A5F83|nr:uncharacterized protein GIQ15_00906 [Arthroderma uncinatum]KAF3491389.1 hypothetical protein GIQ15_00906 [Arthroderma uncinatum]
MATRRLLITGATGKQGGAVLDSLLSRSSGASTPIELLAVTRNIDSARAKHIASKPNVTLVQSETVNPTGIFSKAGSVDSVFLASVAVPFEPGAEEEQALPTIDASIAHGVKHIVYTSIDRGGPAASNILPTQVGHFAAKYRIEQYLKEKASKSGVTWTILQPAAYIENISPDLNGKAFASMWAGLGDKPLQMVSVKDIGHFGALALLEPEKYKGQTVSIAGDELTFKEACAVFKETMGYDMPQTYSFVGSMIRFLIKDAREMMAWLATVGYQVDIPTVRESYAGLRNFATYLKESSGFKAR